MALSYDETAEALGLSRSTVKQLVSSGRLPAVRVGRRVLIPAAEIERFLQSAGSAP
jgi:excisionase family DNA binding protein